MHAARQHDKWLSLAHSIATLRWSWEGWGARRSLSGSAGRRSCAKPDDRGGLVTPRGLSPGSMPLMNPGPVSGLLARSPHGALHRHIACNTASECVGCCVRMCWVADVAYHATVPVARRSHCTTTHDPLMPSSVARCPTHRARRRCQESHKQDDGSHDGFHHI